jgi:hypothetical protein
MAGMAQETSRQLSVAAAARLCRRGATAVAVARVALGAVALARPSAPARPWVGEPASELASQVLARALGGRDIALGLGALNAARQGPRARGAASGWFAAGALSDALDVTATVAAWPGLPRVTRWLIAASAGGAAVAGALGAVAMLGGQSEAP